MPETAMWTLIVSLVIFSLGVTLKAVEYRASLDKANKDITDLRAEVATLNQKYEQAVAYMAELDNKWTPNIL
jgi:phage shock protein A